MPENVIEIPIRLSDEQANAVLQQLRERASFTGKNIQEEINPKATGETGSFFEVLKTKMLDYRREETQQARSTRFFANEIAGLVPVGTAAASTVSRLAMVLGGGGLFAAGFEAAKWAIQAFTESQRKAQERAEQLKIAIEQMASAAAAATVGALKSFVSGAVTGLPGTTALEAQLLPMKADLKKINDEIDTAIEKMRKVRQSSSAYEDLLGTKSDLEERKRQVQEAIEWYRKEYGEIVNDMLAKKQAGEFEADYYQRRQQLREQFWAQDKSLSRQAVLSGMNERDVIKQQLAYQIADLRAYGVEDDQVRRAIANARVVAMAKLSELDAQETARLSEKARQRAEAEAADLNALGTRVMAEYEAQQKLREHFAVLALAKNDDDKARELESLADWARKERDEALEANRLGILSEEEYETRKTAITDEEAKKRAQILTKERKTEDDLLQHLNNSVARYAQQTRTALTRLADVDRETTTGRLEGTRLTITALDALGGAVEAFASGNIDAMAKQAAVEGLVNAAKAAAALAMSFLGFPGAAEAAAQYGLAAAIDFSVAGVAAGLSAAGAGAGSGGSSSTSSTTTGTSSTSSESARDYGVIMNEGVNTRETVIVIGDPFETPAETARRAARRIQEAQRLDMLRRTT